MIDWQSAFWVILVGAACNVTCALLGCYLVLRRLSLLGDAISHAVLPGIAIGFLLTRHLDSWLLFAGAMASGVLTSFLTETLRRFGRVPEDASLGAVFTALFAAGVLLINTIPDVDLDPGCVLYGTIDSAILDTMPLLGVEVPRALQTLVPALLLTVGFIALLWKELKVCAFDPALATAMGLNSGVIHYLLMGMVAMATVAAFQVVGSVLVVAMLIVPAAAAHLLTDRLVWMLLLAALVGTLASAGGYAGAVALNTSTAGAMAVAAGLLFAAAVLFAPRPRCAEPGPASNGAVGADRGRGCAGPVVPGRERKRPVSPALGKKVAGGGAIAWLALRSLQRRGLLSHLPGPELHLTPAGRERARFLVRSHRLWEAYLEQHFALPLDHLHEAAERVEHFISPVLEQKLSAELENPASDPHGRPIPGDEKR